MKMTIEASRPPGNRFVRCEKRRGIRFQGSTAGDRSNIKSLRSEIQKLPRKVKVIEAVVFVRYLTCPQNSEFFPRIPNSRIIDLSLDLRTGGVGSQTVRRLRIDQIGNHLQ
jgi:hypothetical protein